MLVVFIRTTIIYLVLLVVMRFMGKRQIGEMQPFEFIVTLLIAELACIPMADVSIPLLYGISAIIAIFVIHQCMSLLERGGKIVKKVISGKPSVVINKQGVDFEELKRNNLEVDDLIEAMRSNGYFSLDDLSYAIFEANGKLSALENPERSGAQAALPRLVIANGKLKRENFAPLELDDSAINNFFEQNGIKNLRGVGVMTVDENGRVYIQEKGKGFKISTMSGGAQ